MLRDDFTCVIYDIPLLCYRRWNGEMLLPFYQADMPSQQERQA